MTIEQDTIILNKLKRMKIVSKSISINLILLNTFILVLVILDMYMLDNKPLTVILSILLTLISRGSLDKWSDCERRINGIEARLERYNRIVYVKNKEKLLELGFVKADAYSDVGVEYEMRGAMGLPEICVYEKGEFIFMLSTKYTYIDEMITKLKENGCFDREETKE